MKVPVAFSLLAILCEMSILAASESTLCGACDRSHRRRSTARESTAISARSLASASSNSDNSSSKHSSHSSGKSSSYPSGKPSFHSGNPSGTHLPHPPAKHPTRRVVKHLAQHATRSNDYNETCSPPIPITPPLKPVPKGKGYLYYPKHGWYMMAGKAETWFDAQEICEIDGGHLAIINSEEELKVIVTVYNHQGAVSGDAWNNEHIWLGAQEISDQYYTVLGGMLRDTGFVNWWPGEPSGFDQHCLVMSKLKKLFCSGVCYMKSGYICEHLNKRYKRPGHHG